MTNDVNERLTPWSYAMLALIGERGAGPQELVDMMRRGGRVFFVAAPSQVYAEPKRLERQGLVTSRKERGARGHRTVYHLTAAGREALVEWLVRPSSFPRIQHEANLRLTAGDLIGDDRRLLASLEAMHDELDELSALMDENERHLPELEHRSRYLRLSYALGRHMIDAHRMWLAEVRAELTPADGNEAPGR